MKKKGFLIYILIFGLFFIPKTVFGATITGSATVGRSAVMDTSNNYYYTNWTSLNSNSLNVVPIPTQIGTYYHMGSEYVYALTLTGSETQINGTVKIPVVSNTIYNYQLMNGLNNVDFKLGIHSNFGQYNLSPTINNMTWDCNTYPHLGVAHNYCFYVVTFSETLATPYAAGSYNLNFAVLNTNGTHSSYYYDGTDSNGCAIEFPVSASNSGYPALAPTVSLTTYSGSSGDTGNQDIIDANNQNTQEILDQMQENYEELVKSQEVCNSLDYTSLLNSVDNSYLTGSGTFGSSDNYYISQFYSLSSSSNITLSSSYLYGVYYCFYDSNQSLISCASYLNTNVGSIIIPDNSSYFRTSVRKGSPPSLIINSCQNGNQAIYDTLMDHDTSDFDYSFGDVVEPSDTPISDLLTLPLTILQKIYTNLSGTCEPYVLPFNLWGNDNYYLTLPCLNLGHEKYFGRIVWGIIDDLFCIFMVFNIAKMAIWFYSNWTTLHDNFEYLIDPSNKGVF